MDIKERYREEDGYHCIYLSDPSYVLIIHEAGPWGLLNQSTGNGMVRGFKNGHPEEIYRVGKPSVLLKDAPLKEYLEFMETKKIAEEIGILSHS